MVGIQHALVLSVCIIIVCCLLYKVVRSLEAKRENQLHQLGASEIVKVLTEGIYTLNRKGETAILAAPPDLKGDHDLTAQVASWAVNLSVAERESLADYVKNKASQTVEKERRDGLRELGAILTPVHHMAHAYLS